MLCKGWRAPSSSNQPASQSHPHPRLMMARTTCWQTVRCPPRHPPAACRPQQVWVRRLVAWLSSAGWLAGGWWLVAACASCLAGLPCPMPCKLAGWLAEPPRSCLLTSPLSVPVQPRSRPAAVRQRQSPDRRRRHAGGRRPSPPLLGPRGGCRARSISSPPPAEARSRAAARSRRTTRWVRRRAVAAAAARLHSRPLASWRPRTRECSWGVCGCGSRCVLGAWMV